VSPVDDGALAREYEEQAADEPGLAFEAAGAWRRAGRPDAARRVLQRVAYEGDALDQQLALAELVEMALEEGDEVSVRALLGQMEAIDPPEATARVFLAELFEARGEVEAALLWVDRALALSPQPWTPVSDAAMALGTRSRVRDASGLAPDELDRQAQLLREALLEAMVPSEGVVVGAARVRMLYLTRTGRLAWAAQWPALPQGDSADRYFQRVEADLRRIAAGGCPSITLISIDVPALAAHVARAGLAEPDEVVRHDHLVERDAAGAGERWPPPRNGPCWCRSGAKYKRCCGRPQGGPPQGGSDPAPAPT